MELSLTSLWFDIAVMTSLFAIGTIGLGHFSDHVPKARRVVKLLAFTMGFAALTYYAGRLVSYSMPLAMSLWGVYIHAVWLPRNGVNGWMGEPREHYYELRGIKHL